MYVAILLDHGASPYRRREDAVLTRIIKEGFPELLELILDKMLTSPTRVIASWAHQRRAPWVFALYTAPHTPPNYSNCSLTEGR